MNLVPKASLPHPIEFEFFSKQSNKTTKLVNAADGFKVEGAHRWYEFEFIQPVYLTGLQVDSSGYDSWYKFEFEVLHIDGTLHQEKIGVEDDTVSLTLGKLVTGFKFRPEARWLKETDILRVIATGYSLEEFHQFEWEIRDIRKRRAEITASEQNLEKLADREANLRASINALTTEVGTLSVQRKELSEAAIGLSDQLISQESATKDVRSELESLQEDRRGLKAEINTTETELDSLQNELRLFPSEIAGFVQEGRNNIRTYIVLGIPFTIILCVILWSLFSSAIDLTQLWKEETNVDVWTIFLTRIPFVLVAIALIEACSFIVGRMIFEIIKINRQRLDFSKLSIIAKDVTTATAADLEMSENERFAEETKLKMSLLQEHMKSQSKEEFKYSGSAISAAIIGVANRFSGKKAE